MRCDLHLAPISSLKVYLIVMMVRMVSSSHCLHIVTWCLLGSLHAGGIEHYPDQRVVTCDHLTTMLLSASDTV